MNPLEDNSGCGSNSLLKSYQRSKILLMIPLTLILLPWHLTAFLFTPRWKCDKHVYLTQLFLRPFKRSRLAGSGFWSESDVQRCFWSTTAPALTPGAEHHPWKATAPRNDRLERSDVAPRVCFSLLVFSASGGVWMRSYLGTSLCEHISGRELSGHSSQLRIMGKKTPFVSPGGREHILLGSLLRSQTGKGHFSIKDAARVV